jgi:hypothetical protein
MKTGPAGKAFEWPGCRFATRAGIVFSASSTPARKKPQRHRKPDQLHQGGNADHQQQRRGGEDFGVLLLADPAQHRRSSNRSPRRYRNDCYDFVSFKPVRLRQRLI